MTRCGIGERISRTADGSLFFGDHAGAPIAIGLCAGRRSCNPSRISQPNAPISYHNRHGKFTRRTGNLRRSRLQASWSRQAATCFYSITGAPAFGRELAKLKSFQSRADDWILVRPVTFAPYALASLRSSSTRVSHDWSVFTESRIPGTTPRAFPLSADRERRGKPSTFFEEGHSG